MASPDSWTQKWRSDCLSQDWWSVKWYATENMCSINSINHTINKSECYDLVLTLHISQNKPNRPWGLVCRILAQTLWAGLIHLVQLIQSRQTTTDTFYNHSSDFSHCFSLCSHSPHPKIMGQMHQPSPKSLLTKWGRREWNERCQIKQIPRRSKKFSKAIKTEGQRLKNTILNLSNWHSLHNG